MAAFPGDSGRAERGRELGEFNPDHAVMPGLVHSRSKNGVAELAYGIHVLAAFAASKAWMAGTSPAMTRLGPSEPNRIELYEH
jgi:hypothetical protein